MRAEHACQQQTISLGGLDTISVLPVSSPDHVERAILLLTCSAIFLSFIHNQSFSGHSPLGGENDAFLNSLTITLSPGKPPRCRESCVWDKTVVFIADPSRLSASLLPAEHTDLVDTLHKYNCSRETRRSPRDFHRAICASESRMATGLRVQRFLPGQTNWLYSKYLTSEVVSWCATCRNDRRTKVGNMDNMNICLWTNRWVYGKLPCNGFAP